MLKYCVFDGKYCRMMFLSLPAAIEKDDVVVVNFFLRRTKQRVIIRSIVLSMPHVMVYVHCYCHP